MDDAAYYVGPTDKEIESIWYALDDYSVVDAIALAAGFNPKIISACLTDTYFERRFPNYTVFKKLIINSIVKGKLPAELVYDQNPKTRFVTDKNAFIDAYNQKKNYQDFVSSERAEPNWHESTISQDDLKAFLYAKGLNFPFDGEIDFDVSLQKQVEELSQQLVVTQQQLKELEQLDRIQPLGESLRIAVEIQQETWGKWVKNPSKPVPYQDAVIRLIETKYPNLNKTIVTSIERVIAPFERKKQYAEQAKKAFLVEYNKK